MSLRALLGWITVIFISACASTAPRALDGVNVGMDKDQVLNVAGNPKRTYRLNSEDHWQYIYFVDDKEFRREVIFAEGKVSRLTRPLAKEQWTKELENTESLEDFEAKARAHQQKTEGKFKTIDGEGQIPDTPK